MEDKKIDLTVAICVYNGEKFIGETLDSLAQQTFSNFKLLIVDDGSTDNTIKVIQDYIKKGNFLDTQIVYLEKNSGTAVARNTALNNANTKYMAFFDADDIAEKELLSKMHQKLIEDENLIAVGCYTSMIDSDGKPMQGGIRLGPTNKDDSIDKARRGKLFFLSSSSFVVAEVKKIGGYSTEGFPNNGVRYADYCEDCDMWTRLSDLYTEGKYLIVIPEKLYRYRKHEKSISNDNYAMLIRMKHIKENVRRRRSGRNELTFIEFEQQISEREKKQLKREAASGVAVRKAGFALHNKHTVRACCYMVQAAILDPGYVYDKLKVYTKRGSK